MTTLDEKNILVAGGAGEVGEGIVRQLLKAGATVIVPSRNQEKLDQLRERLEAGDPLVTVVGDVGSVAGAEALRDEIQQNHGQLDAVVASLGGWWQGLPLTQIPLDLWHKLIDGSLTAHFITARTFLPVIANRPGSSYTLINGAGGLNPIPTAGPISVSTAGQMMLQKVLAKESELAGQPVRINSLVLVTPIITRSRPQGKPNWLTANNAGEYVAYLTSSSAVGVSGETIIFQSRDQLAELH